MTAMAATLPGRLEAVERRIQAAVESAGRERSEVTLVAVTKMVERAVVDAAYASGLRAFGENRVADARAKFAAPLPADARLHLIGQLQTNKAAHAVALFDIIESVDRSSLVEELSRQADRRGQPVAILLQVNVAGEAQKAGCAVEEVDRLVDEIMATTRLDLRGLMTIAPLTEVIEETRPVFSGLRALRDGLVDRCGLPLPLLSMGMSNDLDIAIQEGATHVRVGRALFG